MILVLGIPILVFAFPIYYSIDIGTSYMYWISSQHWIVILQYWILHFQYTSILVLHILQYWIMRSWYWYWAFHCWLLHSHFITISVLQIRWVSSFGLWYSVLAFTLSIYYNIGIVHFAMLNTPDSVICVIWHSILSLYS